MDSDSDLSVPGPGGEELDEDSDIDVPGPADRAGIAQAAPPVRMPRAVPRSADFGAWIVGDGASDGAVAPGSASRKVLGFGSWRWTVEAPPGPWDASHPAFCSDRGGRRP